MPEYRIDATIGKMTSRHWEASRWLPVALVRGLWYVYTTNRGQGTVSAFSITRDE